LARQGAPPCNESAAWPGTRSLVPTLCVGTRLATLCVEGPETRRGEGDCPATQSVAKTKFPRRAWERGDAAWPGLAPCHCKGAARRRGRDHFLQGSTRMARMSNSFFLTVR